MTTPRHASTWRLLGALCYAACSAQTPGEARADTNVSVSVPAALAACESLEKLAEQCATYDKANDLYLVGKSRLAIDWLDLPRKIQRFKQDVVFTSWQSAGNAHSLEAQCVAVTPDRVKLTSRSGKTVDVDISKLNASSAARANRILKIGPWLQTRADRAKERVQTHLAKAPTSPVPIIEDKAGPWTYAFLREANAREGGSDRIYTELLPQLSAENQHRVLFDVALFITVETHEWEGKGRRVLIEKMHAKLLELVETAIADQVKPPVVPIQEFTVDELEELQVAHARELSLGEMAAIRAALRDSQQRLPRRNGKDRSLTYEIAALGLVIIDDKRRSQSEEWLAEEIRDFVEMHFHE